MTNNNDTYYSIQEVATLLKVVYLTVYRWIRSGKLIAYKAGKQHRIKKTDLDKFMKGQK
jgi:excisionase family DNA binding protein